MRRMIVVSLILGLPLVAGAGEPGAIPASSDTYKNQPHAHVLTFQHRVRPDKGQILNPGENAPTTTLEKSNKELSAPEIVPSTDVVH